MRNHRVIVVAIFASWFILTACNSERAENTDAATVDTSTTSSSSSTMSRIVSSKWEGEIAGQVYNKSFRLPLTISIAPSISEEDNPMNLTIGVNSSSIGSLTLFSATQVRTPQTGRTLTLQYFAIEAQDSRIRAVLMDDHRGEAAVINGFTAPNVSAESAPSGPAQELYKNLGSTELFAFHEGTEVILNASGDSLNGTVEGSGSSYTGIFPTPDVNYRAEITARRVR